jgi:iron complex transport system ATP-binding protein
MLSVRGLHAGYPGHEVLKGIDLEVPAGEVVALVGPNGCGKTTLLRAVTRVVPWSAGDVLLGEVSARGMPVRELSRRVAVVPQNPLLPVGYTALECVVMGRTPHLGFLDQEGPGDVRMAEDALARVGAGHLSGRRVDELSGGERQNVVLARALAQQAPILLLDEPTANLDIGHQVAVALLVRELAASGLAVLAAVHDLTLASLYSDRIVLMADGRVVAAGSAGEVLTPARLKSVYGADVTVVDGILPRPIVLPWTT